MAGCRLRFTAYDGSADRARRAPIAPAPAHTRAALPTWPPRRATWAWRAPTSPATSRSSGVHPGDPYSCCGCSPTTCTSHVPTRGANRRDRPLARAGAPRAATAAAQEALPRWRRALEGLRHSRRRDAEAIHHHYDVSNAFYEYVLGPSMTYTCACYPTRSDAWRRRRAQVRPGRRKLGLQPGMRLLDVGCGWGGMVRHAARQGVTRSASRCPRSRRLGAGGDRREGLHDLAEVRHRTTATSPRRGFDAISSIGLTEHIGVRNYPAYFRFLRGRLRARRAAAQPLHHPPRQPAPAAARRGSSTATCSPTVSSPAPAGSSATIQDVGGLEVRHEENLREHYALTLRGPGARTWWSTGTRASPRSARPPPGCGACTWRARGWASSATGSSCTRCSP